MTPESEPIPTDGRRSAEGWQGRLLYVIYLAGIVGALLGVLQELASHQGWKLLVISLSLLTGLAARERLRRTGRLRLCFQCLINCEADNMTPLGTPEEEARFARLLARRIALEDKRGSPGFDVWEFQSIRSELAEFMDTHPVFVSRLPRKFTRR
jgi:hypothetical protein